MEHWTDRLSEYVDGELDATSTATLEQHLRECDECSAIVADLRMIKASASALQPAEPVTDLWSGIAAQIAAPAHAHVAPNDATVIQLDAHRARRRSITMSMPQLAAAAVLLLALGGAAMWRLVPPKTVRVAGSPAATPVVAVRSNPTGDSLPNQGGYDAAIEQLEQAAEKSGGQLDPKTTKVIQASMATIDRAIADARAALAADPANSYLHRHLDRTMKQKLELLRQTSKIERGGA